MNHNSTARPLRSPYAWMALAAAGAAAGLTLSLQSQSVPGTVPLTVEDFIDAVCLLLFGFLGAALLVRRRAEGLARALLLIGTFIALDYLLHGVADALARSDSPPSAAARLCNLAGEAAFIATFLLLVFAPLSLFPTGRLPSRRWQPLTWVCGVGLLVSVLALLLTPGPVDADVPAWGDNPIGLESLPQVPDALELAGGMLFAITMLGGLSAFVTRWIRYRGLRRRQMAWLTLGATTMLVGIMVDVGGSELFQVLLALAIFGTLLAGMTWPLLGPLGRAAENEPTTDPPPPVTTRPGRGGPGHPQRGMHGEPVSPASRS